MFKKNTDNANSIEKLLSDIDGLDGSEAVRRVIKKFIGTDMAMADGLLIIYTRGKSVDIDGTRFTDSEAVWALSKATNQILNNGLSFK
jgi:hypothetical protein